jgi:hypothetical protein
VKNLENKDVMVTHQLDNNVPLQYEGFAGKSAMYLAPRTFGVKLSASF